MRIDDKDEYFEAMEAICKGLKDVEEHRVHDAREALEELRIKLGVNVGPQSS